MKTLALLKTVLRRLRGFSGFSPASPLCFNRGAAWGSPSPTTSRGRQDHHLLGLDLVSMICVQGVSASFVSPDVTISASCLCLTAGRRVDLGEASQRDPLLPRDVEASRVFSGAWKRERTLVLCLRRHIVAWLCCCPMRLLSTGPVQSAWGSPSAPGVPGSVTVFRWDLVALLLEDPSPSASFSLQTGCIHLPSSKPETPTPSSGTT